MGHYCCFTNATVFQNSVYKVDITKPLHIKKKKQETYHSFQNNIRFTVFWRVDNTRAVNEEDAPHQSDVLPHLKRKDIHFSVRSNYFSFKQDVNSCETFYDVGVYWYEKIRQIWWVEQQYMKLIIFGTTIKSQNRNNSSASSLSSGYK